MLLPQVPDLVKQLGLSMIYFDDFVTGPAPTVYTHLVSDGGTSVANSAVAGGWAKITTGATNNNEAAISSAKCLLFAQDKPFYFQTRVRWTEANTDDVAIFAGVSSAFAADMIVDGGASMVASHSGAGFYKAKDTTVWKTHTSKGATQTTSTTEHTASGSAQANTLGVYVSPIDATYATCTFFIDTAGGQNLLPARVASTNARVTDAASNQVLVAISSAAAMAFGVYAKAGGANSETPEVDYFALYGART